MTSRSAVECSATELYPRLMGTRSTIEVNARWASIDGECCYTVPGNIEISALLTSSRYQDGRVVKALDLSSNGHMSAWVRTPLLVKVLKAK